jgi:hypothetical protein
MKGLQPRRHLGNLYNMQNRQDDDQSSLLVEQISDGVLLVDREGASRTPTPWPPKCLATAWKGF